MRNKLLKVMLVASIIAGLIMISEIFVSIFTGNALACIIMSSIVGIILILFDLIPAFIVLIKEVWSDKYE